MKFLNKLERKIGRFAIPNLPIILVAFFGIGYLISFVSPEIAMFLTLDPEAIMQGEVWRLISWMMVPPSGASLITMLLLFFVLYFYYFMGCSLQNVWGAFVFNIYIFAGIIFTDLGVMVAYWLGLIPGSVSISTYYLCMSMFLAYATCFPEMRVLLFMIIPIKVKYMGYIDGAFILWTFLVGDLGTKVVIIMLMLNFLIFFLSTRNYKKNSPMQMKRRKKYKKQVRTASMEKQQGLYKCAICGQTKEDNPELEFRYCSKCKGNLAYCQNHLFSHTHVK